MDTSFERFTMYCHHCGAELKKDARFCSVCGAASESEETTATDPSSAGMSVADPVSVHARRKSWKVISFVVVFAIVSGGGFFGWKMLTTPKPGEVRINPKDGADMVWVPSGYFLMGSKDGEGMNDEHPMHRVYLDGYWIYKYPVTVAQYRAFCIASERQMPMETPWGWQDNYPIVNLRWEDANAYAQWAEVSLPTEAQWEKAARGTDGRTYPWGNFWDTKKFNYQTDLTAMRMTPVDKYPAGASPYGCMDMVGNAWEWCADWYGGDYYKNAPARNPTGPATGQWRALRSGGWNCSNPELFRVTQRWTITPNDELDCGFRCALPSRR